MKKLVSGIMIVMIMFSLVACGSKVDKNDPILGTWNISSIEVAGQVMDLEALNVNKDAVKLEVKADGKFSLDSIDPADITSTVTVEGTWTNKDGVYTFTAEGAGTAVTLSEDGKTLSMEEDGSKLSFSKS